MRGKVFRQCFPENRTRSNLNRLLALLTTGILLSLALMVTVNASSPSPLYYNGLCNLGTWYPAAGPGQVQINICNNSWNSNQGSVQYEIRSSDYSQSLFFGGCNTGPCSKPTATGINPGSYLILRFTQNYVTGIQIFEPDVNGNIQQAWFPYNQFSYNQYGWGGYPNCNPYYQVCYGQSSNSYYCPNSSCSALIFRIAATPFTINLFYN